MTEGDLLVGEALIGADSEIAHIDLMVGNKSGPVGQAVANSLAQPRMGHTPILAVIRPNLPVKPLTLIVPKVTLRDLEGAERMFGPAQSAVAKAVADAVDEGMIPRDKVEDLAVIVSVFIHPRGKDYQRIYRYNYGATKLALKRALTGFPDIDTVLEEKPKAAHDMIGFRINNLELPPYLGVELRADDWRRLEGVLKSLPRKDGIVIKVGAPVIKKYGMELFEKIHRIRPETVLIADMKTLDTGNLEARMAMDSTADAVAFSGLAPIKTQERFIKECSKIGILSYMDNINVSNPLEILETLEVKPDVVELQGDIEKKTVEKIREICGKRTVISVSADVGVNDAKNAVDKGADIVMVSEKITNAPDINLTASAYLQELGIYEVDQFRVMTDF